MYLHDPRAERALILSVTDDTDFADAVSAERAGRPTHGHGWLEVTASGIVARAEQQAVELCAEILDLSALVPRLRQPERPQLVAGIEEVVRAAHAAFASCRAVIAAAERADAMEEVVG